MLKCGQYAYMYSTYSAKRWRLLPRITQTTVFTFLLSTKRGRNSGTVQSALTAIAFARLFLFARVCFAYIDLLPDTLCISMTLTCVLYREVQLDLTPDMAVLYMLFERCHTKNRKIALKHHIRYFNFRSKFQLDHPVPCWSKNMCPAWKEACS